jgi:hypothetical protein
MKKLFLICFSILTASASFAQLTPKDVFTKDEIVWYGLDFSKAKFLGAFVQPGKAGDATGNDIKTKWIPQWNSFVVSEPQKFDFKKALDKGSIYNDLKPVEESNSKIVVDNMKSMNTYKLPKEEAEKVISTYSGGDKKEGIGMVFVVESFDKGYKLGTFWVVFFDIKTKKVLFSEHVEGTPNGGGLRNFWGGAVRSAIKQIDQYK